MRMRTRFACLAMLALATSAAAQEPSAPPAMTPADSLYVYAQRLVNEGKGAEGRAIVDSLFRVAAAGTPAQAEALFWRATLATTAAEAERDYRQITVEHPLSRRAEDALLRLAQLELQRGERALALTHLERLIREHGNGPARARGAYWSARVLFEMNDVGRACQSLNDARAALPPDDVELRNQVEYAAQRCPTRPVAAIPAPVSRDTTRTTVATSPPVTSTTTAPVQTPAPTTTLPVAPATTVTAAPSSTPDTSVSAATRTAQPPTTATTPARTPPTVASSAATPQRFSVQVAAYQTKAEADRLVKKFRANGYDARTFGTVAPFRVRIGRFRTRTEAVDLAKILKEKSGAAFVVVAEPR